MAWRYQQPDNEHGFELVCLRLYRKVWQNESLKLYAKRGERQDGVDIFDPLGMAPVRAVQCKFHEPTKTLPPAEIKVEVAKAESSDLGIDHYVIATTAKKSRMAQDTIVNLNQRPDKRFTVDIHFWEEICEHASQFGLAKAEIIMYGCSIAENPGEALIAAAGGLTTAGESKEATEPYATIESLLNERRVELARYELDKLAVVASEESPPGERYKLLRLRAKLAMESGDFDTAAELFLEAHAVSPDLDQAKQNQVLALELLGRTEEAYAHAAQYVAAGLSTPGMVLRLIGSTTSLRQLEDHAALIEGHAAVEESVNTALAHKYLLFGHYGEAEKAAERALQIAPDSPHAHVAMAMAIHSAAVRGEAHSRLDGLRRALEHYARAEPVAREQRFDLLLPEILVNRAAAKALSGDIDGAAHDYRAAVDCATQPAVYAERAVGFFLHEQDFESAWEFIEFLDRATNEGRYLILVTESNSGSATDRRLHITEMEALANRAWDRAVECRYQCVQWALDLNEHQLAESLVPPSFQAEHPFQAHALIAWVRLASGDIAGARDEAVAALEQSIRGVHPQELRALGQIFVQLKDDANALGLLEQVANAGIFDDDMKKLIACAQRLDRHDLLLRLCRELRTAGVREERLLQLEIQLLSKYAPREALGLTDEFTRISKTPKYFVAFRNMLAVRLNDRDELNLDASVLPTPAELPPEEAYLVLLPWIEMGKYEDALAFLYAQRRIHFENQHAHGRYIFFFLRHSHRTALRNAPATAEVGCSVLLELAGGELRWVTIEDDQPIGSRGEFSSKSAIGEALTGKRAGDTFEMPDRLVQAQTANVREIQSKYVRGFQDSIENFAKWFPGNSILQPFDVGDVDKPDLTVVVESLKGRREHVDKCLQIYRDQPVPLFLLADCLGVTELDAVKALARRPNGVVKCSDASPESFSLAVQAGVAPGAIVLSMPTIISLTLVDGWKYLDEGRQYFVSQMTSELIDGWIQERAEERPNEGGVLAINEADQLVFMPLTADDRRALLEELQRMRGMVDKYCDRVSSAGMAALEPGARKIYEQVLGVHNLEAMCAAKDHRAILWTDDVIMGTIAKADFGAAVMWTQLALRCFAESGQLTLDDFELVTAKLAADNYGSVIWHPCTIIAAGRAAAWDVDSWPLWQCVRLIEKSTLHISGRTQIVVETLKLLRRSECSDLRQSAVIQALLNALGNPRAVRWILHNLDGIFRIDFCSANFVRPELERWLQFR